MAKIEGSIYCKNCSSEIKWCYLIKQQIGTSRILEVDTVSDDTIIVNSNPYEKIVRVHCKFCDCVNIISENNKN